MINIGSFISTATITTATLVNCAHSDSITANIPVETYKISPHFIGYNNNWVRKSNVWQDPQMRNLFKESSASNLRYPGGTNSSYWDFANDTVFKNLNPRKVAEEWIKPLLKQNFINPVEELGLVKQEMGDDFTIVFVANLVTEQRLPSASPESEQWYEELDERYKAFKSALKRAEAVGINIQYVELGNEYYFPGGYYGHFDSCKTCRGQGAFPRSGRSYANAANYFAKKLKTDYPEVNIAAIGTITTEKSGARQRYWNSKVVSQLDRNLIDAITIHFYHSPTPSAGLDDEAGLGQTISSWNHAWARRAKGGEDFDRVPVDRSRAQDWDVWYTEYAAFRHEMQNTWHYAFYVSNAIDYWLTHTHVTLTNKQSWKTSFNKNNTLKPYVQALSLWSEASINQEKAGRLIFSEAPNISGSDHEGVIGWMFTGKKAPKVVLVNYTASVQSINLGNIDKDDSNSFTVKTAASDSLLEGPSGPRTKNYQQTSKIIKLAPFSISLIEGVDLVNKD